MMMVPTLLTPRYATIEIDRAEEHLRETALLSCDRALTYQVLKEFRPNANIDELMKRFPHKDWLIGILPSGVTTDFNFDGYTLGRKSFSVEQQGWRWIAIVKFEPKPFVQVVLKTPPFNIGE